MEKKLCIICEKNEVDPEDLPDPDDSLIVCPECMQDSIGPDSE